jgi:nitric oxide dioxygenase
MTPHQITLVQNSWRKLRDVDPAKVGDLFYSKLFLDFPQVRPMFPEDMRGQYLKLLSMLNVVVARLDHLDELSADIAALARRHVNYGVTAEHYGFVGSSLLWTLERGLGADWTPDVAEAWTTCYGILSGAMIGAAENVEIPS